MNSPSLDGLLDFLTPRDTCQLPLRLELVISGGISFLWSMQSDSQLEDETEPSKHGYDQLKIYECIRASQCSFLSNVCFGFYADIFIYKCILLIHHW